MSENAEPDYEHIAQKIGLMFAGESVEESVRLTPVLANYLRKTFTRPTPPDLREAEALREAAAEVLVRWMPLSMEDRAAFKKLGEAVRAFAALRPQEQNHE